MCNIFSQSAFLFRYSAVEKKIVQIDRPNIVRQYNNCMGGVDQMDANVQAYRISIRGKKWWHPIVTWLWDVAMANAWNVYRQRHPNKQQLDFRREVVREILLKYAAKKALAGMCMKMCKML
jgi:hypothetical protein